MRGRDEGGAGPARPGADGVLTLPREGVEYLRRLRAGLAPLPEREREEIVLETASHLLDRLGPAPGAGAGQALGAAFAALGEPEDYAARFVTNYRISAALASGSPLAPVAQVLRMIGGGLRAFVVGSLLLVLWSFSVGMVATAVMKPILPRQTGLFVDAQGRFMSLGIQDAASLGDAREILGWWVIPAGLVGGALCALAASHVARSHLRGLRR